MFWSITEYGVSNLLSNIAYSIQLINTAYPLPLDTTYRSSVTEAEPRFSYLISVNTQEEVMKTNGRNYGSPEQDPELTMDRVVSGPKLKDKDNSLNKGQFLIGKLRQYDSRAFPINIKSQEVNGTSNGLALYKPQLNNLGREIKKERGFGSLPSSTETNPRDQVKSISTTIEADSYSIRRIGSSQYAVSTRQNSTLLYKSRKTMVPFPSLLDNHYCEEEEGNYGSKFAEAYGASHINDTIPQKEKDPGSFTLPCYINNVCFDNAFVDLGASVNAMPLLTYLNLGLGELGHTKLTVELADRTVKYPKGIAENVLRGNQGDDLMAHHEEGRSLKSAIFVGTYSVVTVLCSFGKISVAYRDEEWAMLLLANRPRERNIDEVGGMHIF
ncbi:ATP-dependent DNA helicase PIF1-like protein [Tanacetum coccineum]